MEKLRYKDYTFRVNPRRLEVTGERQLARAQAPFAGEAVYDLGPRAAVVYGEGEFFGANAMQEYLRLEAVYRQGEAGLLYLPGLKPFMAHFALFKAIGEPGREGLSYAFRFVEATLQTGGASAAGQLRHIVRENETLFAIAARYNTTAASLLRQNPAVASPNRPTAGQVLTVTAGAAFKQGGGVC